jgi:hypothetical protein
MTEPTNSIPLARSPLLRSKRAIHPQMVLPSKAQKKVGSDRLPDIWF